MTAPAHWLPLSNWLAAPGCDVAQARRHAGDFEASFGWYSPDEDGVLSWAIDRRASLLVAQSPYAAWQRGHLDLRAVAWLGRN